MKERAPVFFFAPFVSSTMEVSPAWIDYNGHMNMAFFHVSSIAHWKRPWGCSALARNIARSVKDPFFVAETHTLYNGSCGPMIP